MKLSALSRRSGLWLRGLLVWIVGSVLMFNDERQGYDLRYQLRGDQTVVSDVVVISVSSRDLESLGDPSYNPLAGLKEVQTRSDGFYWDVNFWQHLLTELLAANPQKIGVSFVFDRNLTLPRLSEEQNQIFYHSKVIWASSDLDSDRRRAPLLALPALKNIGVLSFTVDPDQVVRSIPLRRENHSGFDQVLVSERNSSERAGGLGQINFRGGPHRFPEYQARDILAGRLPKEALKDKIILVGPDKNELESWLTPLGFMTRTQLLAQLVDNRLANRFVQRTPYGLSMAILFAYAMLAVIIMTLYPSQVANLVLVAMASLQLALSIWVFDVYSWWIPGLSAALQTAAAWMIFVGYQVSRIEKRHWDLQQEQQYLSQLEQLKNNFVSLISHDLKTPIAKIQAVVARMRNSPDLSLAAASDLQSLQTSAEELNRYIASILKLLRVEARDFRIHVEVGDLNETIREALAQVGPLAVEKSIALELQLEPLFSSEFDHTLIREVVINLLENAIKYSPADSAVKIRSWENESDVFVQISDSGPGIPPEELQLVWGKFVRGKDQDLRTKGTGLGLYLVKYFVELHGGRVYIESQLRQGTSVTFHLPFEAKQ